MRNWIGFRWYCVRHAWRAFCEKAQWSVAWCLPRKIALLAFVRVYSASTLECPHEEYSRVHKAWEAGAGR